MQILHTVQYRKPLCIPLHVLKDTVLKSLIHVATYTEIRRTTEI